jgi:hypothetical protein
LGLTAADLGAKHHPLEPFVDAARNRFALSVFACFKRGGRCQNAVWIVDVTLALAVRALSGVGLHGSTPTSSAFWI